MELDKRMDNKNYLFEEFWNEVNQVTVELDSEQDGYKLIIDPYLYLDLGSDEIVKTIPKN